MAVVREEGGGGGKERAEIEKDREKIRLDAENERFLMEERERG